MRNFPLDTTQEVETDLLPIVSDATLITQRFHFAPTPHEHRHILGWYRLIQELRENNVCAVCIFDGKERSVAKGREVFGLTYFPNKYPISFPLTDHEKTFAKEGGPCSRGNGDGTTIAA